MDGGNQGANPNDVVIQIADTKEAHASQKINDSESSPKGFQLDSSKIELTEFQTLGYKNQLSTFISSASPDIATEPPAPDKPSEISAQFLTRNMSFENPNPESNSVEPHEVNDAGLAEEKTQLLNSPSNIVRLSGDEDEDEENEDVDEYEEKEEEKGKIMKTFAKIEWTVFMCVIVLLILSLTVNKLQNQVIWELKLWKWFVLVVVIFCGRLVTKCFMNVLLFLIERNFSLKHKLLYFVEGLRTTIRVFIWLALVLLARFLLFQHGVKRSKETTDILSYITRALASSLVGTALWMVKTFSVNLLAISFQSKRFLNPIQETICHQFFLQTLSGPPLMEIAELTESMNTSKQSKSKGKGNLKEEIHLKEVIYLGKLKNFKRKKVSPWTMKKFIKFAISSKLSTITIELDEMEEKTSNKEINNEMDAKVAAYRIFSNVAQPASRYIYIEDLLRFLPMEEARLMLTMFGGVKISRSELKKWLVKACNERKYLRHFLKRSNIATEELNKLFTGIVIVVIIILWLILMGILTTKAFVFVLSQIILVAFMFGNTAKNVFEAIIFLFVMHPFDVGDRCVIDGEQVVVEEIHILTTTLVRQNNETVFYPNSILATKPIINFYRSIGNIGDCVEFIIDVSTPLETISALKSKIKDYLDRKSEHWIAHHSVVMKEIQDANKMIMVLHLIHTINFQNYDEKITRRSELVFELKKIFDELGITKCLVLPPENYGKSQASAVPQPVN